MQLSRMRTLNPVIIKLLFAVVVLFCHSAFCAVEVKIAKGTLKGQILKSRDGRPYYSYTGIPYAKPPVGELRFEAPEPVDPWNGTLDATKSPNICLQEDEALSQEDCLYLNVYSPSTDGRHPVMFWIYGGAFYLGHANFESFGPEYFMDKDIVLITSNYRLGALGMLSMENDVLPGNYALKDQVMALRWVQENIDKFGGDPGKVTVFGGSSGAASTGYHMISPMSKGLFHKAILQSGSPLCRWSILPPGIARNRTKIISDSAGCTGNTSKEVLKCLKKLPASFFTDYRDKFNETQTYCRCKFFIPVMEHCGSGQKNFLCHHQLHELKQESFVPAMIGLNSAEGGMEVSFMINDTSLPNPELLEDLLHKMSLMMSYENYALDVNEIGKTIIKKYFPTGKVDPSYSKLVELFTDGGFIYGMLDTAYTFSSPVYFYLYDYQNEFSFNTLYGNAHQKLGVTHGDELISLFKLKNWNHKDLNEKDLDVSKLMVNIWSKFAASDIPTIDGTESNAVWPPFEKQKQSVLYINSDRPSVIENPFEEKYKFWNSLSFLGRLTRFFSNNVSSTKREEL